MMLFHHCVSFLLPVSVATMASEEEGQRFNAAYFAWTTNALVEALLDGFFDGARGSMAG